MKGSPALEEWRRLYEAALRVKELAPWEWMEEVDVFGVQDPETEELGFVSVMGFLGEHYAVSVYRGAEALHAFWDWHEEEPTDTPDRLLETPQLQASFEDRELLDKEDRQLIKDLGFKFRGRHAWPLFRTYRPGFLPWFMEAEEARFLTWALEQLPEVAQRFREDPDLLYPEREDAYLVRVPQQREGALTWEDRLIALPAPQPLRIEMPMNTWLLEGLKRLKPSDRTLEVDLFLQLSPVKEKGDERPYFPYMLMVVDAESGMILGSELLPPLPSLQEMWGKVPMALMGQWAGVRMVPARVQVKSGLLYSLLGPLAEELGFALEEVGALPGLDLARRELQRMLLRKPLPSWPPSE